MCVTIAQCRINKHSPPRETISWVIQSSLAVDSNGSVHISYYDETNLDLKYATNSSGTWVTSTIDSTGDVGRYTSIALDTNNKVHISYYDLTNGKLKYATNQ
jgi:hypothetical protein